MPNERFLLPGGLKWSSQLPWVEVVVGGRVDEGVRDRFWAVIASGGDFMAAVRACGAPRSTCQGWMRAAGLPLCPGRPPLVVRRDRFWSAWGAGMGVVAASRAAGVSRNSGAAWLAQAGVMRARRDEVQSRASHGRGRLTFVDRCSIEELLGAGFRPARIAELLGRSRSTISRELVRGRPPGGGRYRAVVADGRIQTGRARPKPRKLVAGSRLYDEVARLLRKRLSPEQVAGRLRRQFPDEPEMWVSHETGPVKIFV